LIICHKKKIRKKKAGARLTISYNFAKRKKQKFIIKIIKKEDDKNKYR